MNAVNQRTINDERIREDRQENLRAQAAANPVYVAIGDGGAPPALYGERPIEYRQRLLRPLQPRCAKFKDVNLAAIHDDATLSAFERVILDDALASARDPSFFQKGELRAIRTADASGRTLTRYVGDPNACWDQFNPPIKYAQHGLASFRTPDNRR